MHARPAQLRDDDSGGDAFCACGYNLRGIRVGRGAACPECGADTGDVVGRFLWHSDPPFLEQVRGGVIRMIFGHFACVPAVIVAGWLGRGGSPFTAIPWVTPVMLQALAAQFMLTPEPGVRRSTREDRRARLAMGIVQLWLVLQILYCGGWTATALEGNLSQSRSVLLMLQFGSAAAFVTWTALTARVVVRWACRLRVPWFAHVIRATWLALAIGTIWPPLTPLLYEWFGLGVGYRLYQFADFLDTTGTYAAGAQLLLLWIALNLAIDGVDLRLRLARGAGSHVAPASLTVPLIPELRKWIRSSQGLTSANAT